MNYEYLYLGLAWSVYLALHSILANNNVKEFAYKNLGSSAISYRKLYVVFSALGFAGIFLYGGLFPPDYLFLPAPGYQYAGLFIAYWGVFLMIKAFKKYDLKTFLGITDPNTEHNALLTNGIFSIIRHPVYAGTILLLAGYVLYLPTISSLIFMLTNMLYLIVGIYLEEKKLLEAYGEEYERYRERVPGIIPKLKIFGKL
ncbi:MAG: methyltransferase family protein [Cyclobacteriaceae bacterium]